MEPAEDLITEIWRLTGGSKPTGSTPTPGPFCIDTLDNFAESRDALVSSEGEDKETA